MNPTLLGLNPNKAKIAELTQKFSEHPNIICFFAAQKDSTGKMLKGGSAVIGDLDIVGNYMASALLGDQKLYDIFKKVMQGVEQEKSKSIKR